jgi:co-chaperonin GroES (HSP10)
MAYKKIEPMGGKMLVHPLAKKEEKVDSIYIPETANAALSEGVVVDVSEKIAEVVQTGDKIIYSTGAGVGFMYKGKPHVWLEIGDLWGKVTKED